MKKIIFGILIALLIMELATACSKEEKNEISDSAASETVD